MTLVFILELDMTIYHQTKNEVSVSEKTHSTYRRYENITLPTHMGDNKSCQFPDFNVGIAAQKPKNRGETILSPWKQHP